MRRTPSAYGRRLGRTLMDRLQGGDSHEVVLAPADTTRRPSRLSRCPRGGAGALGGHATDRGRQGHRRQQQRRRRHAHPELRCAEPPVKRNHRRHQPGESEHRRASAANDYRMVPVTGDVWLGFYVSSDDGGATWFNTMVPGFPSDTSPAGLASPLLGLDASGDPVVRFDADGNLYVAGIAFNRNFDQPDRPVDTVVYVAKYDYTPGTPAGTSTPNSRREPAQLHICRHDGRRPRCGRLRRARRRSASPARSPTRSGWRST